MVKQFAAHSSSFLLLLDLPNLKGESHKYLIINAKCCSLPMPLKKMFGLLC